MHIHSPNVDMEKVFAERIPRSSLPSNFGGDAKPIEVLHKQLWDEFIAVRDFYAMEEKQSKLQLDG